MRALIDLSPGARQRCAPAIKARAAGRAPDRAKNRMVELIRTGHPCKRPGNLCKTVQVDGLSLDSCRFRAARRESVTPGHKPARDRPEWHNFTFHNHHSAKLTAESGHFINGQVKLRAGGPSDGPPASDSGARAIEARGESAPERPGGQASERHGEAVRQGGGAPWQPGEQVKAPSQTLTAGDSHQTMHL